MTNAAFQNPSAGSAPFNEQEQMHTNEVKPDTNGDPEGSESRLQAQMLAAKLPDGFYVDFTGDGKPIAKPFRYAINSLAVLTSEMYHAREQREDEFGIDTNLNRALTSVFNNLNETNEFVANGFVYGLARDAAKQLCNAMRWVEIHSANVHRHTNNGNEDAAESALLNFEASRTQAFKTAQLLDWCVGRGVDINFESAARDALSLAGWQLSNTGNVSNRQATQQNTMQMMFSSQPATPEEEVEDDDNDDAS